MSDAAERIPRVRGVSDPKLEESPRVVEAGADILTLHPLPAGAPAPMRERVTRLAIRETGHDVGLDERRHESHRACREQHACRPISSRTDREPSAVLGEEGTRADNAEACVTESDELLQCTDTSDGRTGNVVQRKPAAHDVRMPRTLAGCEEADVHRPRHITVGLCDREGRHHVTSSVSHSDGKATMGHEAVRMP